MSYDFKRAWAILDRNSRMMVICPKCNKKVIPALIREKPSDDLAQKQRERAVWLGCPDCKADLQKLIIDAETPQKEAVAA